MKTTDMFRFLLPLALALPLVGGCYSAPDVSEPPVLNAPTIEISPITLNMYPGMEFTNEVPLGPSDDYDFRIAVTGTPGRFDNGDPDAEQWTFNTFDATMTLGGEPYTTEWVVYAERVDTKYWLEFPMTDAGKTLTLRCTVSDAIQRKSNEVQLSVLLRP
jgi:hypothetical protein